jgi:uncharacterized protein YbjT (DUF2867 family)
VDPSDETTIAVAGANGFLGRHLPANLPQSARLIGLSRDPRVVDGASTRDERSQYDAWRLCDLFSRRDALEGLHGADQAVYLVHSGRPSARLSQSEIRDLDVLCADNFARAARAHELSHIVYVSGLLPDQPEVPPQLAHRGEVRDTLGSTGVPVTSLRTSLILGPGGTSSDILMRLVRRLPLMILPAWADVATRPIDVEDMAYLVGRVLGEGECFNQDYDVGGPDVLTFRQMLRVTAQLMGRRRAMGGTPVDAIRLSTAWVSFFSGVPYGMIRQLVEGLRTEPRPSDRRLQHLLDFEGRPFRDSMTRSIAASETFELQAQDGTDAVSPSGSSTQLITRHQRGWKRALPAVRPPKRGTEHVRSVQRLPLPTGRDARWVARSYADWLPSLLRPLLRVDVDERRTVSFYLWPLKTPLLVLRYAHEVSHPDRQLYWVTGGFLAAEQDRGRLEFREVLDGRHVIAALHEFEPALPWFVYRWTQAVIHLWVMRRFAAYLSRLDDEPTTD